MKKIYYIGHYSDPDNSKRKAAPAADTKMNYIIEAMKKSGYEVEIISFCIVDDRSTFIKKNEGYTKLIGTNKVHFFTNYSSKYRILRILGRMLVWFKEKNFIKKKCFDNESIVVVYHSLKLKKLYRFLHKKKKKFVLEVEEIYSDVSNKKIGRKKEIHQIKKASSYILPTSLIYKKIDCKNKPFVIVHGTYKVEESINESKFTFDKDRIHCVYAGTFDSRKGGVYAAIESVKYLDEKYHMHILGFGTKSEIENVKKLIKKISKESKSIITYDGLLIGNDYKDFIQNCHIGLSTQNPIAKFNDTSFPSKILSYMSNGIRVVSIKIPVVEQSSIGDLVYYYQEQTPQEIAKTIMSVKINEEYNSKKRLEELSKKFEFELQKLLENKL